MWKSRFESAIDAGRSESPKRDDVLDDCKSSMKDNKLIVVLMIGIDRQLGRRRIRSFKEQFMLANRCLDPETPSPIDAGSLLDIRILISCFYSPTPRETPN
ncbi:MAG TPA: hypothetical protein QF564_30350 [Pirellulaceae bacterium]|jgi:hypothetical protein|nr:hypothetical protein [Pirellulaceae bacterium]